MKNKNLLIENIILEGVEIFLDEAESLYLTEEFVTLNENSSLDLKSINNVLTIFKENSKINYFSIEDINKISLSLLENFKKKL
tara:strand:- start:4915 stop:5163 length:249 start_codon:yes stop_codon:yes gene_type:complete